MTIISFQYLKSHVLWDQIDRRAAPPIPVIEARIAAE